MKTKSAVPDVLGPDLDVVFCGINPGRVSAAAHAHFANPRNDFWRLLHDAALTPRQLEPSEQFELLDYRIGATNAAVRTTPGSSDLRRADFADSAERLRSIALELRPWAIAFVGKEAYRGTFGERADHGPLQRALGDAGLFVLPSTSPANAAVPYAVRLEWFRALKDWLEPVDRAAVRAVVLDEAQRTLLVKFRDYEGRVWWATPGGGIDEGEDLESALRRELAEELGLDDFDLGQEIWAREHIFAWRGAIHRQQERIWLVEIPRHEPSPRVDLAAELVVDVRWWTLDELETAAETLVPERLPRLLRDLRENGAPAEPLDVGV
ncbi:MAG TPA: NUDIX domain-containing protein [Gaiellaceae bacterium]|nr:NUDIX domain-containing protein [Gaiellaceae bacterium]